MIVVVDTNILIGRADADDEHHEVATEIVRGIDHGTLPTGRVTNYVALEALNWISDRKHHQKAVETYERLKQSAGFEVVHAAEKDFATAVEIFRSYQNLSFGDATIAAYMKRENIQYIYSLDDDFDSLDWVTRLDTADNPYN